MSGNFHECPTCQGAGVIPLTGIYAETLRGVRRLASRGGYVVANRDASWFGCKPTALNNRLAMLENHGYVYSEKYGRQRRFFLCVTKGRA